MPERRFEASRMVSRSPIVVALIAAFAIVPRLASAPAIAADPPPAAASTAPSTPNAPATPDANTPARFFKTPSQNWHEDALWKGILLSCDTNRTLSMDGHYELDINGPPVSTSYEIYNDYRGASSFDLDFINGRQIKTKHVRLEAGGKTTVDFPLTACPPYRLRNVHFGAEAK